MSQRNLLGKANYVNLALIGAGMWGSNYLRVLSKVETVIVSWCCDIRVERLQELGRFYPHIRFTTDFNQVIYDSSVDAVIIATPPQTHFDLAMKALDAGKHILMEKPFVLSYSNACRLWEQAERRRLVLMAGHIMEYNPALQWLKAYLRDGKLGTLFYLYFSRSSLGLVRQDVNVVWDLAVHDLAVLRFLLEQDPESISAQGGCYLQEGIEDVAFISLRFPRNVFAQVHASWLESCKTRRAAVVGNRQMVVFDDIENRDKIWVYDRGMSSFYELAKEGEGAYKHVPRYGDIYLPAIPDREPLQQQCEHFIECIYNGEKPLTGKKDILWVTRVGELTQLSLKNGGVSVAFNSDTRREDYGAANCKVGTNW